MQKRQSDLLVVPTSVSTWAQAALIAVMAPGLSASNEPAKSFLYHCLHKCKKRSNNVQIVITNIQNVKNDKKKSLKKCDSC